MRVWCFRSHLEAVRPVSGLVARRPRDIGPVRHDLGSWFICGIGRWPALVYFLIAVGVLDAPFDGGLVFWRLRFWRRSTMRMWCWPLWWDEVCLAWSSPVRRWKCLTFAPKIARRDGGGVGW